MAKRKKKSHEFQNKLILNQWLISLFGIDPFSEHLVGGRRSRPFHLLKEAVLPPSEQNHEGRDKDGLHYFYKYLADASFLENERAVLTPADILRFEENISSYTEAINEERERKIEWKYFQWLCLLFSEIYLERYFFGRDQLLEDLNTFVDCFNAHWKGYQDVAHYERDDLNKVCLQMATGSGKTLLMHANLLQFRRYAEEAGAAGDLSRVLLITPNERLSRQHIDEMVPSGLNAANFAEEGFTLFTQSRGLNRVDVIDVHKLADEEGDKTIATRTLGDQNLLLVDEGHRGLSGSTNQGEELGAWMTRRRQLAERGFTFEYSATFAQAVSAANNNAVADEYAKSILFDYAYRWFYEDGYGKDYKIDNLPKPNEATLKRVRKTGTPKAIARLENKAAVGEALKPQFLTAALLKFHQQLRIYDERFADATGERAKFNLEKPLWVFVGSSVTSGYGKKSRMSDVADILHFFADFLSDRDEFTRYIRDLLDRTGAETGLIDENGHDVFGDAFGFLGDKLASGESAADIYADILERLFHNRAGGTLQLERLTGDSGEVILRVGTAEEPFGLISVGDAKSLCDHVEKATKKRDVPLDVTTSDFSEPRFDEVKDSDSPFNLLLGSRKFTEGWDCWRVSTLGLMNIGRSEGAQIIQLFGRGVRLKGYDWSLKRSGHADLNQVAVPSYIDELETLNVFGIQATYMAQFREILAEEGLPGNEERKKIKIPLNVTYDFGKNLKILRPKKKRDGGGRYDFKADGPVPQVGRVPDYLKSHRVTVDYYPRIEALTSRARTAEADKKPVSLKSKHLALLDYDKLYFELERYKAERGWHNLNITKAGIREVLANHEWYDLLMPPSQLEPSSFAEVGHIQRVTLELMKRYCERLYNYEKRAFTEPRLEVQELTPEDENVPDVNAYTITVDGSEKELIKQLEQFAARMKSDKPPVKQFKSLRLCNFEAHLFQPLLHVSRGSKLTVRPVSLNDSEFDFVLDLKEWCETNEKLLANNEAELYLLRNLSRGKGVGFFEASNFHPDFIMWLVKGDKQYVTFVDPHGLQHTGKADPRIEFADDIKAVENRLGDPDIVLNSFILSPSRKADLNWEGSESELAEKNVLFMKQEGYVDRLFGKLGALETTQTRSAPVEA